MRASRALSLTLPFFLALAGCRAVQRFVGEREGASPSAAGDRLGATDRFRSAPTLQRGLREGEMGIVFQNGVECLGEEAVAFPGDHLFVSPEGDDAGAGTSRDRPLHTLAYAACNLRPGQTLHVLPGTYHESVILGDFGDPDRPITIQGEPQADSWPVLDGENTRTVGIALVESSNIIIQDLEFRNYTDEGLLILLGEDLAVRRNRFFDNGRASTDPDSGGEGFGMSLLDAQRAWVEDNLLEGNGPGRDRWLKNILGMGIDTFGLRDAQIRNNTIRGTIGGGILVEDGANVLVEDNLIEENELNANGDYWDGGVWVDGSVNVTIRGNLIRGNHGPGLNLSDEGVQYPQASYGFVVQGNTVTENLFGVYVWNFGVCPAPQHAVSLQDNQIEHNTERDFWCLEWGCGERKPCD